MVNITKEDIQEIWVKENRIYLDENNILNFIHVGEMTEEIALEIVNRVAAQDGDLIFFVADQEKVVNDSLGALRIKLGHDFDLVEKGWRPLWVVDFPMFEKTEDGWTFCHHPFTAPVETDIQKQEEGLKNVQIVLYLTF